MIVHLHLTRDLPGLHGWVVSEISPISEQMREIMSDMRNFSSPTKCAKSGPFRSKRARTSAEAGGHCLGSGPFGSPPPPPPPGPVRHRRRARTANHEIAPTMKLRFGLIAALVHLLRLRCMNPRTAPRLSTGCPSTCAKFSGFWGKRAKCRCRGKRAKFRSPANPYYPPMLRALARVRVAVTCVQFVLENGLEV